MKIKLSAIIILFFGYLDLSCFGFQIQKDINWIYKHGITDKHSRLNCRSKVSTELRSCDTDEEHAPGRLDNDWNEYWFNKKIHTLGNTGFFGALHAAMAPLSTKMIDRQAYGGVDVRALVSEELCNQVQKSGMRILDLCCGVGMSTRALYFAFRDAEIVTGIDTSPEMLEMARFMSRHDSDLGKILNKCDEPKSFLPRTIRRIQEAYSNARKTVMRFVHGNAEKTSFPDQSFDLVTIMYALHEAPQAGRYKIFLEVQRILRNEGTLAIIDILPEYKPSRMMLAGEPYILEYQKNIQKELGDIDGFTNVRYKVVVPGHVGMWLLSCGKK